MGLIRITGGQWRGLRLQVPAHGVRPSSDRIRQAIFSSLGAAVERARVLDLFAGSGAYGLEALSRGAASACWVEADRSACAVLLTNLRALAPHQHPPSNWRVICADATHPGRYTAAGPFDLIFADPPYRMAMESPLLEDFIRTLTNAHVLRPGGIMVVELSARAPGPSLTPPWTVVRARRMGDSQWLMLRTAEE